MRTRIDFSTILASSIHDMKNSLGMVINSLEAIVDSSSGECHFTPQQVAQIQYEAKRVNDNLIQLLTIYKVETSDYAVHRADIAVDDFIEEAYLHNKPLLDFKGIEVEIRVPEGLYWVLDRDLVAGVLDNVINNAIRYTADRLRISAQEESGYLHLLIEDDGSGFPEPMLICGRKGNVDFTSGRTGLGLYFASVVAQSHADGQREGYIELRNGGDLGGGRFSLYLP